MDEHSHETNTMLSNSRVTSAIALCLCGNVGAGRRLRVCRLTIWPACFLINLPIVL